MVPRGLQGWFGRVPSACSGFHLLSNIGSNMGSNIGSNMGSNIVRNIVFLRIFFPTTAGNGSRTVPWTCFGFYIASNMGSNVGSDI